MTIAVAAAHLLSPAALHGRTEIAAHLVAEGADVNAANRDGNTPLHAAAFLYREEIVKQLLVKGASLTARNNRKESPPDVVAGPWNEGLADFYHLLGAGSGLQLDLTQIEAARPRMAKVLRDLAPARTR